MNLARLVLAAYLSVCCALSHSAESAAVEYDGRAVVDVLETLQSRGFKVLYSSGLVRPQMIFVGEPGPGSPISRLREALEQHSLTARVDADRMIRIVRTVSSGLSQLTGVVADASTGEPLGGVKVTIGGTVTYTDTEGRFVIPVHQARSVRIDHSGYLPAQLTPLVQDEADILHIALAPDTRLEEVVVVSSRYAVGDAATRFYEIDQKLMSALPSLGEDPLRITSHLPGMASLGVSAKPHIRGGVQDELLVLFNDIELLEPFHLRDFRSVFSSFNPSVIDHIDIYTGGFPARYGDRMSGVMDIDPVRDLNPVEASGRGELGLSLLNVSAVLRGSAAEGRGRWLASARRGTLDLVAKEINSDVGDPAYSDGFFQYRHEISPATELDVGAIVYTDDVELSDFDEDGEIATSGYRNRYGWVKLDHGFNENLAAEVTVYGGKVSHRRRGFLVDEDLDNGFASVDDRREVNLVGLQGHFEYNLSAEMYLEMGARLVHQRADYLYSGLLERGELAGLLGTEIEETRDFRIKPDGLSGGWFSSFRWRMQDLSFEAGLRWDFQGYREGGNDTQFSPRLSMLWEMNDKTRWRASAGRFYQPEAIHELQVGDGVTIFQKPQYADHFILGVHHEMSSAWTLRAEMFQKIVRDPKSRYENLLNPLVLLPELASDRFLIEPERARTRGIETTLRYQNDANMHAWLTLSFGEAEDRIDSRWEPRTWDQGASVSAGVIYDGPKWTLAAALQWHEGWRTTDLPTRVAEDVQPLLQRNDARLKDYLTLDLEVSRTWRWKNQSLTAFLEVTNALARRNVGGIEYDIEEDGDDFILLPQEETLLPLVPSLGLRWRF